MCYIMYANVIVAFNATIATTSCLGPLNTTDEVTVYEGGTAELPCFLPAPSRLPITGASWARDPPSGILFPALIRTQNGVQWNSTNINTDRVTYSDQNLNTHFNVTVRKVKTKDVIWVSFL